MAGHNRKNTVPWPTCKAALKRGKCQTVVAPPEADFCGFHLSKHESGEEVRLFDPEVTQEPS